VRNSSKWKYTRVGKSVSNLGDVIDKRGECKKEIENSDIRNEM